MTLLKSGRKFTLSMIAAVLMGGTALAQVPQTQGSAGTQQQQSYDEEQVDQFVAISKKVTKLQQDMQESIEKMAQEKNIDMGTLQAMGQAQQTGGDLSEYSEEEQKAFKEVMTAAQQEQQVIMTKVQEVAEAEGMDMMTFQQMSMSVQSDPELQQRVQKKMMKSENKSNGEKSKTQQRKESKSQLKAE